MARMLASRLAGAILGIVLAAGAARASDTILGTNPPGTMFHSAGAAGAHQPYIPRAISIFMISFDPP